MHTCPSCATPDLAFATHDHAHCATDAMARAEHLLQMRGQRLTPVRRRALEILLESHRALGAYDMLRRLAAEGFGHQPPVAYRALDFLAEQGLAHRIRSVNGFAACMHPGEVHTAVFLICRLCATLSESRPAPVLAALRKSAGGFKMESSTIESIGLCAQCQSGAPCN